MRAVLRTNRSPCYGERTSSMPVSWTALAIGPAIARVTGRGYPGASRCPQDQIQGAGEALLGAAGNRRLQEDVVARNPPFALSHG